MIENIEDIEIIQDDGINEENNDVWSIDSYVEEVNAGIAAYETLLELIHKHNITLVSMHVDLLGQNLLQLKGFKRQLEEESLNEQQEGIDHELARIRHRYDNVVEQLSNADMIIMRVPLNKEGYTTVQLLPQKTLDTTDPKKKGEAINENKFIINKLLVILRSRLKTATGKLKPQLEQDISSLSRVLGELTGDKKAQAMILPRLDEAIKHICKVYSIRTTGESIGRRAGFSVLGLVVGAAVFFGLALLFAWLAIPVVGTAVGAMAVFAAKIVGLKGLITAAGTISSPYVVAGLATALAAVGPTTLLVLGNVAADIRTWVINQGVERKAFKKMHCHSYKMFSDNVIDEGDFNKISSSGRNIANLLSEGKGTNPTEKKQEEGREKKREEEKKQELVNEEVIENNTPNLPQPNAKVVNVQENPNSIFAPPPNTQTNTTSNRPQLEETEHDNENTNN